MPTALTIAGSDPTGGAGLQADLGVFRSHGVHGMGVLTALTVQDSVKVHQVLPAFPSVVLDQLRVLLADMAPDAIKVGMLASDDIVRNVMLALATLDPATPVVLDPILLASDGSPLLERRAWHSLVELFPMTTLITPNLHEAEALAELDAGTRRGAEDAARVLIEDRGARAVLIKGGHRDGAPNDLLARTRDGELELRWLDGERIEGPPAHGTGCALAASIAAGLACGASLADAVDAARHFVRAGLASAVARGKGAPLLGTPGAATAAS